MNILILIRHKAKQPNKGCLIGLSYFDESKRVSHHISCVYQDILKTLHDLDRSCKEKARLKPVT